MSNVVEVIKTMAQLIKYANEHGVLEVVTRSKDGKIAKMSKLLINNAAKSNAATQLKMWYYEKRMEDSYGKLT